MDIFNALTMLGGLSLFLYGMSTMGNGLSKMTGGKLESVLERLTKKRFFAVLLGAGVTAVIQSSSATTVMVVGFVNSGIMKLSQAVGIIMGANIGTTITSWLLSLTGIEGSTFFIKMLKPSSFAPILAIIGTVLIMVSNGESKKKDVGNILLGFFVLMFGMETMSGAVSGLANNPSFTNLMTAFKNPILGMAVGAILTAIIQSSSASVGILQALSSTGAVYYSMALPIIMGQNIGTCITSIISSIGANRNAKRAAMIHLYFNLIGTILFMTIFYLINTFVGFAFLGNSANAPGIAVIHTVFNIGATVVLFPFSNKLVRLAEISIPGGKSEEELQDEQINIDERFLDRPSFAMELCRNTARRMSRFVQESINLALDALLEYDKEKCNEVIRLESLADKYEDTLGSYLVKLSSKNLSLADSQSMSILLHSIGNFERISDHAMDIVKAAQEMHQKKLTFSGDARKEIETLCQAVKDVCELTVNSFCLDNNGLAMHVEPLEEVIDTLSKRIKENHIKRLRGGKCTIDMGFILDDILTSLERASDHCSNVAIEMVTIYDNKYNTHEYFKNFSREEMDLFNKEYEGLLKKYPIAG